MNDLVFTVLVGTVVAVVILEGVNLVQSHRLIRRNGGGAEVNGTIDMSRIQEPQNLVCWCEKNGFDLIALESGGQIAVALRAKDDRLVFHRWTFPGGEDHCDIPQASGRTVGEALAEFARRYSRQQLDLERRIERSWLFGLLKFSRAVSLGSIRVPPLTYKIET